MALTRRTPRFGELAAQAEELLTRQGIQADPDRVDRLLRERVGHVGRLMGISDRAALRYAPDDLPAIVAADTRTELARSHLRILP